MLIGQNSKFEHLLLALGNGCSTGKLLFVKLIYGIIKIHPKPNNAWSCIYFFSNVGYLWEVIEWLLFHYLYNYYYSDRSTQGDSLFNLKPEH